jgi:hypothetical protein
MNQERLTPEQQKDIEARIKLFDTGYRKLVEDLQIDLISFPEMVPTEEGFFVTKSNIMAIDKKYRPVKSPFITEPK